MKITRYKKVQRYLTFYRNNFQFRTPYQVLIDATFCQSALKNKVNIREQMAKYLNDSVKLLTTVCVVNEAERLGAPLYGAMLIIKQFNIRKCDHQSNPIAANQCLLSLIKRDNNSEHYLLATQDPYLSDCVRNIGGCPLIYMKMNTIVMEKPSDRSDCIANQSNAKDLDLTQTERIALTSMKEKQGLRDEHIVKKKRKGPKGPNPLSCKKKKQKTSNSKDTEINKKNMNKRKRNRVPRHIKRMFGKIESQFNNNDNN